MNTLRWVLLILGALILFAIYWYDKKRRPAAHRRLLDDAEAAVEADEFRAVRERREPRFDALQAAGGTKPAASPEPETVTIKKAPKPEAAEGKSVRPEPKLEPKLEPNPEPPQFELKPAPPQAEPEKSEETPPSSQTVRKEAFKGLDSNPGATTLKPERTAPPKPAPRIEPKTKPSEDKLVVLYVVSSASSEITGEAMTKAFAETDLQYGEMKIFERTVKYSGKDEVLFRVANMVKPGTFELSRLREYRLKGLTLFMQLPGPVEGLKAFNTMLFCAQSLADKLGGEVLDSRREPLDSPSIEKLRGEIQLYSLQRRQAGFEH